MIESAKLRVLHALFLTCSRASRVSYSTCSRALHAQFTTFSCALHASCPKCSHAPLASCHTYSCTLRASCTTCSRASLFMKLFSLRPYCLITCVIYVLISPLKSNKHSLPAILWSDNQYLPAVWYIWIIWNQLRKHIHKKLKIILVQVKVNLNLDIIIIKSYSYPIDEIAADLSNSFAT